MYPTPAEPTFLLYSIILTNPIVESMSQAKPRRESNPKLVQRFHLYAAQATAPWNNRCKLAQIGVNKPPLCQKKARFCWCWVHYIKMPTGPVNRIQCRQRFATAATFLRSCVAQARAGAKRGPGGPSPPMVMLYPPIKRLSFLKTAAFVLNFKFWPPLINTWPP